MIRGPEHPWVHRRSWQTRQRSDGGVSAPTQPCGPSGEECHHKWSTCSVGALRVSFPRPLVTLTSPSPNGCLLLEACLDSIRGAYVRKAKDGQIIPPMLPSHAVSAWGFRVSTSGPQGRLTFWLWHGRCFHWMAKYSEQIRSPSSDRAQDGARRKAGEEDPG
jgi:hypothetical protein